MKKLDAKALATVAGGCCTPCCPPPCPPAPVCAPAPSCGGHKSKKGC
ncbi:hypothetical protein [Methylobacterium sp. JK268]